MVKGKNPLYFGDVLVSLFDKIYYAVQKSTSTVSSSR